MTKYRKPGGLRKHTVRSPIGFIYVISSSNGYLKVGRTDNAYSRYSGMQCNSPIPLTLAYACRCSAEISVAVEAAAHEALASYRRHREWFEVDSRLAIEAVREAFRRQGLPPIHLPARVKTTAAGRSLELEADILECALARAM